MLDLIPEDRQDGKFRKHHIHPKNIGTNNKHFTDQQESHPAEDEKPTTAAGIKVEFPPDNEAEVQRILRKHEKM